MKDCITHQELQQLLRQFTNLENIEVEGQTPTILTRTVPAVIKGIVLVHGQHYQYELEIDLRTIKDADRVLKLVESINKSFEGVARNG